MTHQLPEASDIPRTDSVETLGMFRKGAGPENLSGFIASARKGVRASGTQIWGKQLKGVLIESDQIRA